MNDYGWYWWPNDIRGPWGLKLPDIHLSYRWGKTRRKTSPRKLVPTGDRTRARCVTSVHATTCSTAVDLMRTFWEATRYESSEIGFRTLKIRLKHKDLLTTKPSFVVTWQLPPRWSLVLRSSCTMDYFFFIFIFKALILWTYFQYTKYSYLTF